MGEDSHEGLRASAWLRTTAGRLAVCTALLLAACGDEVPGASEGPGTLVHSQPSLPSEEGFAYADIVTRTDDLDRAWQRFRLTGPPPHDLLADTALLFAGIGESGSCPATFDGLAIGAETVRVHIGHEGGPACTDDYNPRTFVIGVPRDALPDGGFVFAYDDPAEGSYVLSSTPTQTPPQGPTLFASLTAEDPNVALTAHPHPAEVGQTVEITLDNRGEVAVSGGGWMAILETWQDQRWVPLRTDQPEPGSPATHPAVTHVETGTVDPAAQAVVAAIDTGMLERGWYGLRLSLQVGGRGGRVDVRTDLHVDAAG